MKATTIKRRKGSLLRDPDISAQAKIRLFLKYSKGPNLEHQDNGGLVSQIDAGESISTVLEEYFDGCIEIQQDDANPQNEDEERRLKLNLDFKIFTDNLDQEEQESKEIPSYWFLKLLASKTSLQPLCKHPYITAFLDLHYSTVKNARKQMVDSVPHLALMLVLGQLASTMPGHLHDNFENLLVLALFPIGTVIFLDIVSLIGEKTEIINQWLNKSLCSPKKQITSRSERLIHTYSTVLYLIGYIVSVSSLVGGCYFHFYRKTTKEMIDEISSSNKTTEEGTWNRSTTDVETMKEKKADEYSCSKDEELVYWRVTLEYGLIAYSTLLFVWEIIQMKLTEKLWNDYFGHSKNWIDLAEIVSTFTIAMTSLCHRDICEYSWMQNLIYLIILFTFFQLVNDLVHCLPNNDFVHIEQYVHMFNRVSVRYLTILAGFLPFLAAFAACFQATADESQPFGGNMLGSALKTFVMFTGEYDFGAMRFSSSKDTSNEGTWTRSITDVETLNNRANPPILTYNHKAEVILGQLIFAAFVFLFAVVVMNLLNAFAIGDIQNLRDDATAIRNQKKIKEIIHQRPEVNPKYYFWKIVCHRAKPQSDTFIIRSLVDKGYLGDRTEPVNEKDGLHFLPHTTFCALKSGTQKWTSHLDKKGNPRELQNILKEISSIQDNIEKMQAKLSHL